MVKIKTLKDSGGNLFYPQTHTKGIVDDNGNNLEAIFSEQEKQLDSKIAEHSTVRFHRIEENEATINAGEIGSTPSAIVYYKPANKFIVADSAGNYWDTWQGMEAYMSDGKILPNKVYLSNDGCAYIVDTNRLVNIYMTELRFYSFIKGLILDESFESVVGVKNLPKLDFISGETYLFSYTNKNGETPYTRVYNAKGVQVVDEKATTFEFTPNEDIHSGYIQIFAPSIFSGTLNVTTKESIQSKISDLNETAVKTEFQTLNTLEQKNVRNNVQAAFGVDLTDVSSTRPVLFNGDYYLNSKNNKLYRNENGTSVEHELYIGLVAFHKGIRYIYNGADWIVDDNGFCKVDLPNGIDKSYSYEGGIIQETSSYDSFYSSKIKVKAGDVFYFRGMGGGILRAFAITDESGNIIYVAPEYAEYNTPYVTTIMHDGYVYINVLNTSKYRCLLKNNNLSDYVRPKEIIELAYVYKDSMRVPAMSVGNVYFVTSIGEFRIRTSTGSERIEIHNPEKKVFYCTYNDTYYTYFNGYLRGSVYNPPLINIELSDTFYDFSNDVNTWQISGDVAYTNLIEKYDALLTAYPEYVSKVDAVEFAEAGLAYPDYTKGITESIVIKYPGGIGGTERDITYLPTMQYTIPLYKFSNNKAGDASDIGLNKRYPIFIISGEHGEEKAGQYSAYLFCKNLCECLDKTYWGIRNLIDLYVIPCINPYGLIHSTRANANKVDICRNFPTKNWKVAAEGSLINYSGPNGGSEFETQLIMALTKKIKPMLCNSAHSYGTLPRQFYSISPNTDFNSCMYQVLSDCSFAFIKNLPEYFGTKWNLFVDDNNCITSPNDGTTGISSEWWTENGTIGTIIETSATINYKNGVVDTTTTASDKDIYAVNEYTMRAGMARFLNTLTQLKARLW